MNGSQQHWDEVWTGRDPETVSWYQRSAERSVALITGVAGDPAAPIVDVGGGASPLAGELLALGYQDVTVLDISAAALIRGRQRLGDDADRVRWVLGDVTHHQFDRTFGLWHDRAVLHFLTAPDDADAYVRRLTRALRPAGYAIIATFGPDGPTSCSGLPVQRYDQQRLTETLGDTFTPVRFEFEVHRTPTGATQQFLYGLFRRAERPRQGPTS